MLAQRETPTAQIAGCVPQRSIPSWWYPTKRALDCVMATMVLTASSPLIVAAALCIMMVSPGSPFFLQERIGKDGRRFKLVKLRTMVDGAHLRHAEVRHLSEVTGPVLKIRNDPRLHRLGKILRRTSIDELPNFINVLRGEMSVVGPRPPLPSEVACYDAFARRRLTIKPGITCLWQINGRSSVSFEHWMQLDNEYVDSWSPWLDLSIVLRTVAAVVRAEGAL